MVVFVDIEEVKIFFFPIRNWKGHHCKRVEGDADFITNGTTQFAFELAIEVINYH